jgi:peptidyl-prolyl cis-trans isomerase A (cyclophilin A)
MVYSMKVIKSIVVLVFTATTLFSSLKVLANNGIIDSTEVYPLVKMETSMGTVIIELNRAKAPITVKNFLNYVAKGAYDNTIFHRVIEDFVVQGGGYSKSYEPVELNDPIFNESGNGLKNDEGTIAMARVRDPHSAKAQFYFNVKDNKSLNPGRNWGYTVFGSINEGSEIIEKISTVKTDFNTELRWQDVPVEPVLLLKATILPAKE